jgi:iron(III) transport system ATP-binding protein
MIHVQGLNKTYIPGQPPAVDDVGFTVEEGAFYTLLGPSGCGKTTTLRCIAGLERPDRGTIELGGVAVVSDRTFVPTHRRDFGMVFQNYAVWPHMTVFQNVAFPLEVMPHRPSREQIAAKVESVLELVSLGGLGGRMATQLSGGQQQRLSVARALVREPSVLLLDEPLSNLDAKLRERMRGELLLIQRRVGITTLFVTHDQVEALSMSDRVAVMNRGRIIQEGTPRHIYHRPANEFVADFIGSTNMLTGSVTGAADSGLVLRTALGTMLADDADRSADGEVMVAIWPEDVVLHHGAHHASGGLGRPNIYPGEVEIGLFGGTSVDYHVRVEGQLLRARVGSRIELVRGDAVHVELPPHALRVFGLGAGRPAAIASPAAGALAN